MPPILPSLAPIDAGSLNPKKKKKSLLPPGLGLQPGSNPNVRPLSAFQISPGLGSGGPIAQTPARPPSGAPPGINYSAGVVVLWQITHRHSEDRWSLTPTG